MESNSQYAEQAYWDKRFESETHFEWLADFQAFNHLILPKLKPTDRILHIGCGSSKLSMDLYNKGFTNITNVDYSPVLIEACRERHPEMQWVCDDIRSLSSLPPGSFDVVLEKATLEALLVTEKSQWSPSDEALEMLDSVFGAVSRVLAPGGLFISVSFTQPHFRLPALLRQPSWGVELEEFGHTFHFFVYSCRLGASTSPELCDRFARIAPDWQRSVAVRA